MKTYTLGDLKKLSPREIDALVNKSVYGYDKTPPNFGGYWYFTKDGAVEPIPHYSTDANEAFKILDHLKSKGLSWNLCNGYKGIECQITEIGETIIDSIEIVIEDECKELAICYAAILASQESQDE